MIKKSLLETVVGMKTESAEKTVEAAGHEFEVYPDGAITIQLAIGNTIKLYEKDGLITAAEPGDPLEVIE